MRKRELVGKLFFGLISQKEVDTLNLLLIMAWANVVTLAILINYNYIVMHIQAVLNRTL